MQAGVDLTILWVGKCDHNMNWVIILIKTNSREWSTKVSMLRI